MAGFFQSLHQLVLMQEPRNNGAISNPKIFIDPTDRLEIIGGEIPEQVGTLTLTWVKVKCAKGEGFAKRKSLKEFAEIPPLPDEELPIEFRRAIDITTLAELCYRNALHYRTNSAIVLALAFAATGAEWSTTTAKTRDRGDRIGIYGFTQAEWAAAVGKLGPGRGVRVEHIPASRAQCEIAAFLTSEDWMSIEPVLGSVRAIDLYLSFLTNADIALKFAGAADADAIATFLEAEEAAGVVARLQSVLPALPLSSAMPKSVVVDGLVEKFDTALDFVKAFAESLITDKVPGPIDPIITTAEEITHEDPIEGTDETLDVGTPIVAPVVVVPAAQPGDGSLLVSEAHLVALWKRSHFPIDGRGIIVFGLRGCLPVDTSGTGFADSHKVTLENIDYRKMRCTIGQWRPGKGFALFPGSTVPYAPFVETAVSAGGAGVNQLGRGRYRNYTPGWHKRFEGKAGHWALLQDCDTTFQRTADDIDFDIEDKWNVGRPGDNLHCAFHMGVDGSIPDSRFSSAGCQVVAGTVEKGKKGSESGPWKKFIAPFLGPSPQSGLEYVLFDGRELQQMILTGLAGKTSVLRMGSEGAIVKQLQQRLAQRLGIAIKADGKFGAQTFRAIIDFQQQNFGRNADDGIVGPETADKLGMVLPPFVFADAISGQDDQQVPAGPTEPAVGIIITAPGPAPRAALGSATDPKFAALLALISSEESKGNYNAFFGSIDNKDDPPFTSMRIRDVRKWQDDFVSRGKKSSAVGRYQIIRKTLDAIVARMGLDGSELFDANMQDRMALHLLELRKLRKFLARDIGIIEFGNQLAMEWASFPVLSKIRGEHKVVSRGQSFYAGDNLNKALIKPRDVEAALERMIA